MKTQKTIAIIMILASSVLTAWASRDIAFPAILCMLGLLGLQRRFTWDIRPERRVITSLLLLLLAVLFALHYRYAGAAGRAAHDPAAVVAWQTIARYFLASMILILFLGSPEQLPPALGLFHIATAISAGQVLLLDDMHIAFRLSELLCVILVVLYAAAGCRSTDTPVPPRARRTARWLAPGLILVLAVNGGWIIGSILYRHVETLNYLPAWFWRGSLTSETASGDVSHVGFSTSGKLSSVLLIKGDPDTTPVLTITSDGSPGYLRARAFDVYRQSEWRDVSHQDAIFPAQNTPLAMRLVGRTSLFHLHENDTSGSKRMAIRHESPIPKAMFTPLGTLSVEAPFGLLMYDDDDIVYPPNLLNSLSYRIGYTQAGYESPPTGMQDHRMLNVPNQLDPRIHRLAIRIFAGCRTTAEKTDAVVNYFRTNYTYSLGLDIPPDRDKLTHFLLEESTGYCEYFASGAAILLRLVGVPTRYVTGFLVTEKDAQGDSWVARNMDAHAWAEAWDQERKQWTIVEATAQEDLAATPIAERSAQSGGSGHLLLRQFLQAVYQYGLFGVLSWLFTSYALLTRLLLLTGLLGGALWLALSRHRNRGKSAGRNRFGTASHPDFVALHKMLVRMDRKVKAAGPRRDITETLHAFSQRLRTRDSGERLWTGISDWYLEYAHVRYGRTIRSERVQQLQRLAQSLQDSL